MRIEISYFEIVSRTSCLLRTKIAISYIIPFINVKLLFANAIDLTSRIMW